MADNILGNSFKLYYNTDTGNTSLQGIGNVQIDNLAAFPTLTISSTSNSFETYDSDYLSKLLSEQTVEPLSISIYYVPDNAAAQYLDDVAESQQEFQIVLEYDYTDGKIAGAIVNGYLSSYSDSGDKDEVLTRTYTFVHSEVVMRSMSVTALNPVYQGDYGVGSNGADVGQYQPDVPTGNSFIKVPASQTGNPTSTDLMGIGLVDGTNVAEFAMTKSGTLSLFAKNANTAWTRIYTVTQMDSTYVPLTRTVNGKPLSSNVVLSASDLAGGTMTGALTVPALTVTGNTTAAAVTATSLTSTGSTSTDSLSVFGTTSLTGVTTAGTVNASTVNVSGNTVHTGTTKLTGVTTAGTVNAGAVSASSLTVSGTTTLTGDTNAGTVNASTVNVSGNTVHTGTTKLTGVTTAGTINATTLTLTNALPITQGGTGATTAAAARTNLGLGTAATVNTGTSGATIPLLSTANTWSTTQNFDNIVIGSARTSSTGLELGSLTTATSAYFDFHSSGNNIDYDSRILASGGSTSTGQGSITFTAANVTIPTLTSTTANIGTVNLTNALSVENGGTGSTTNDGTGAMNISALPMRGNPAGTITDINAMGAQANITTFVGIWDFSGAAQYNLTNVPEAVAGTLYVLNTGAYRCTQQYITRYGNTYVRSATATWTAASPNNWGSWIPVGNMVNGTFYTGDLNTLIVPGDYAVTAAATNGPWADSTGVAGRVRVETRTPTVTTTFGDVTQTFTVFTTSNQNKNRMWKRTYQSSASTWGGWSEYAQTGDSVGDNYIRNPNFLSGGFLQAISGAGVSANVEYVNNSDSRVPAGCPGQRTAVITKITTSVLNQLNFGVDNDLNSNYVQVAPGEILNYSVDLNATGLTNNTQLRFVIVTYNGTTAVSNVRVASYDGASGGWQRLNGTYIIPTGVTQVYCGVWNETTMPAGAVVCVTQPSLTKQDPNVVAGRDGTVLGTFTNTYRITQSRTDANPPYITWNRADQVDGTPPATATQVGFLQTMLTSATDGTPYARSLGQMSMWHNTGGGGIVYLGARNASSSTTSQLKLDGELSLATFSGAVMVNNYLSATSTIERVGSGTVSFLANRTNSDANSYFSAKTTAGQIYFGTGNGSNFVINSSDSNSSAWLSMNGTAAGFSGTITAPTLTATGTINAATLNITGSATNTINGGTIFDSGLEIGIGANTSSKYIDFHTSGNSLDYDSRILASGGTTSLGGGNLTFTAANTTIPTLTSTTSTITTANVTTLNLTNDLSIANGGTGASTATAALSNLGAMPLAGGAFTGAVTSSDTIITTDAIKSLSYRAVGGTNGVQNAGGTAVFDFSVSANTAAGNLTLARSGTGSFDIGGMNIINSGVQSFSSTANGRQSLLNQGVSGNVNYVRIPISTTQAYQIVSVTAVQTQNSSGDSTITFPVAFTTINSVVCSNGDGAVGNLTFNIINSIRTAGFDVRVYNNGTAQSGAVRVNYIATGLVKI